MCSDCCVCLACFWLSGLLYVSRYVLFAMNVFAMDDMCVLFVNVVLLVLCE